MAQLQPQQKPANRAGLGWSSMLFIGKFYRSTTPARKTYKQVAATECTFTNWQQMPPLQHVRHPRVISFAVRPSVVSTPWIGLPRHWPRRRFTLISRRDQSAWLYLSATILLVVCRRSDAAAPRHWGDVLASYPTKISYAAKIHQLFLHRLSAQNRTWNGSNTSKCAGEWRNTNWP